MKLKTKQKNGQFDENGKEKKKTKEERNAGNAQFQEN